MTNLTPDYTIPVKGDVRIGYPQSFKGTWKLYEIIANQVDTAPTNGATPALASAQGHHGDNTITGLIDLRQITRLHVRGRTDKDGGSLTVMIVGWGLTSGSNAFEAGDIIVSGLILSAGTLRDASAGNYITNEEVYDVGFLAFAHVFATAKDITSLGYIDVAVD